MPLKGCSFPRWSPCITKRWSFCVCDGQSRPHRRPAANTQNIANKLLRTFNTQVETLKRYRSKGEQKVMVEHVHVHQGGQAIVGNVTRGRGMKAQMVDRPMQEGGFLETSGFEKVPAPGQGVGLRALSPQ